MKLKKIYNEIRLVNLNGLTPEKVWELYLQKKNEFSDMKAYDVTHKHMTRDGRIEDIIKELNPIQLKNLYNDLLKIK